MYHIYQTNIKPAINGKRSLCLQHFETYDEALFEQVIAQAGWQGDLPAKFVPMSEDVKLGNVSFTVGIAKLTVKHVNDKNHTELSRDYVIKAGKHVLTITHDVEPPAEVEEVVSKP